MKRFLLLLPLLLAPAQAGNLGAAYEAMFLVPTKETPDYSQTSFKVQVSQTSGPDSPLSVASFSDGLFKIVTPVEWVEKLQKKGYIDGGTALDESGISPSQVISFDSHNDGANVIYSLLYRDSEGKAQVATWNLPIGNWADKRRSLRMSEAKAFLKAFLNWMSTDAAAQHQLP